MDADEKLQAEKLKANAEKRAQIHAEVKRQTAIEKR